MFDEEILVPIRQFHAPDWLAVQCPQTKTVCNECRAELLQYSYLAGTPLETISTPRQCCTLYGRNNTGQCSARKPNIKLIAVFTDCNTKLSQHNQPLDGTVLLPVSVLSIKTVVHHYYYCGAVWKVSNTDNKGKEMRGAKKGVVLIRIVQSDYLN